jgi:LacI family transcriptional regulator
MKVTIVDIAKELKIDPSTVSLALRDSPKISAKTTERVKETAAKMGYQINPYVSALMSARRQGKLPKDPPAIAFITSSDSLDGWKEMYNANEFHVGCLNVAQSLGMKLEPFWIGEKSMSAERLNDILYNRGIQGGVFLPTGTFREKMNHEWQHLAAVSYGIYDISPSMDRVKADHYGNMEKILGTLTDMGFNRIGFVMDIPYPYTNHNRWLGAYLMVQRELPTRRRLAPWLESDPSLESFKSWYEKQKPDVIICVHAESVNGWLTKLGHSVPGDISLATLGTAREDKRYSGMIENSATCGKLAMEMLLDRIHHNQFGSPDSPRYITVRGRWNPGQTLRAP